jgi:hypothetical protein
MEVIILRKGGVQCRVGTGRIDEISVALECNKLLEIAGNTNGS